MTTKLTDLTPGKKYRLIHLSPSDWHQIMPHHTEWIGSVFTVDENLWARFDDNVPVFFRDGFKCEEL